MFFAEKIFICDIWGFAPLLIFVKNNCIFYILNINILKTLKNVVITKKGAVC